MLNQQEQTADSVAQLPTELPLPPLLSLNAQKRQPPVALREAVGPMLAPFVYNYQQAGSVYRYLDRWSNKVKTVLSGADANLFAMQYAKTYLSARTYRRKQMDELKSEKYIVAMDGEPHYHMRKLQKQGYSRSILEGQYDAVIETMQQALAAHQSDEPLEAYRFFQKVCAIQLGKSILNHDATNQWEHVCTYIDGMLEASFAPRFLTGDRLRAYQDAEVKTMALADEMITEHQASQPETPRPDIVDDLLTAVSQDASLMDEQDLRVSVLTPLIAGINPVAHTCSCLLYALLTHPDILSSVVNEINVRVAQDGLNLKTVRKMKLLRFSILEALRLYPFAPVLEMTAIQEFEFNGYRIKPDTAVVLGTTIPHFLEEHFANPFSFDITRYYPERAENRQPGVFAPYGVGPHICLGAGFAEDQMLLTMAALLNSASLKLAPNASKPIVGLPRSNAFAVYIE